MLLLLLLLLPLPLVLWCLGQEADSGWRERMARVGQAIHRDQAREGQAIHRDQARVGQAIHRDQAREGQAIQRDQAREGEGEAMQDDSEGVVVDEPLERPDPEEAKEVEGGGDKWVEDPESDIMDAKVMRKGKQKLIIVDMPDPAARWRRKP